MYLSFPLFLSLQLHPFLQLFPFSLPLFHTSSSDFCFHPRTLRRRWICCLFCRVRIWLSGQGCTEPYLAIVTSSYVVRSTHDTYSWVENNCRELANDSSQSYIWPSTFLHFPTRGTFKASYILQFIFYATTYFVYTLCHALFCLLPQRWQGRCWQETCMPSYQPSGWCPAPLSVSHPANTMRIRIKLTYYYTVY